MKYVPWVALLVLGILAGRALFPRTVTVTELVTIPGSTDTVVVTTTELDSIEVVRFRDRPVVTTDTLVLRDTVFLAGDTLEALPLQWRLRALAAGHRLDMPTFVSGEALAYDGRLTRLQSVEQYPVTLGPVRQIWTDERGIHVDFGEWPEPPKTCGTWCRLQWGLGGLAAGIVLWEVAR